MKIKNHTTKIDAGKTVAEIEAILARHGVSRISKEYDGRGGISALFFAVRGPGGGDIPFRLPINAKAVMRLLEKQRQAAKNSRERSKVIVDEVHANRVGWRILRERILNWLAGREP